MTAINSNPLDKNGLQITEGAKVHWNDPERYEVNGYYLVDEVHPGAVALTYLGGDRPNYCLASFDEVAVQVR